jgi:hypothetical protein
VRHSNFRDFSPSIQGFPSYSLKFQADASPSLFFPAVTILDSLPILKGRRSAAVSANIASQNRPSHLGASPTDLHDIQADHHSIHFPGEKEKPRFCSMLSMF